MNTMGIGININEAQVLLMSVKENSDFHGLHMNEFMNLLTSQDDSLDVDLSQIKPADAKGHDPEL